MKLLWALALAAPFAPHADGAGVHMSRHSRSKHLSTDLKVSADRNRQQNQFDVEDASREVHVHHKKHAHFLDASTEVHNFQFSSADWSQEKFELCSAKIDHMKRAKLHDDPVTSVTAAGKQATCNASEITLKDEAEDGITESCCPKDQVFCAGCAKADESSCLKCAGGFIKRDGLCTACADSPGWLDGSKSPCSESTTCSDEIFRGLSSNQACCKCGGGVVTPTPFSYLPEAVVFGQEVLEAKPVPRTASFYSVDKGCQLGSQGLTINSATGALEFAPGCKTIGCERTGMTPQPFEIKCTVTAHQSPTLSAKAEFIMSANFISYGSPFLVVTGDKTSFKPKAALAPTSPFSMSCVPSQASEWVSIDTETGELTADMTKAQTLSGITGNQALQGAGGGICTIFNMMLEAQRQASVVLYAPREWSSFAYGTTTVYASIGEYSSTLAPVHTEVDSTLGSRPPTRFSAACKPDLEADYTFDSFTGIGELNGHTVFVLDVKTGKLKMSPSTGLSVLLDTVKTTAARRTIELKCAIYGHYEWSAEVEGSSLATELSLQVRDDTCWTTVTGTFLAADPQKKLTSLEACRSGCRAKFGCTHFFWSGSECNFVESRCEDTNKECKLKNQEVEEKIPNCGERSSCINFKHPQNEYLSGDYCPFVDNGASGPVYRKLALTAEDTFYLTPYDEARDSRDVVCPKGWVVKQPDLKLDFQDEEAEYLELHGKTVACLAAGVDIVAESFMMGTQKVAVTGMTSDNVIAGISALPCGPPNITFDKKEEENEEEEDGTIEPIVLDDPTTAAPDDHWLHPCECFPDTWSDQPVDARSVEDVPAGSGNSFSPLKFDILKGEFFCEQEALLPGSEGMIILDDGESTEQDFCEVKCREDPNCNYVWQGEIMSTKQCRFYKHCTVLVREAGASGTLSAMPDDSKKYCRMANPDKCWKVTKRRNFLSAQAGNPRPNFLCAWESLIQQCDHKLLLGGVGVEECGRCTYAATDSHAWQHKAPVAETYQHGRQMTASCWAERFAPVPVGVGNLKAETLTCIAGNWFGSKGHPGLSGFACAACVQVVQYPYPQMDDQGKQELYFTNALEVQILVDAKIKMLVNKEAELETCDITLPDKVGTVRLRSLASEDLCFAKQKRSNNLKMLACTTEMDQLFFFDGERVKSASKTTLCASVTDKNIELAKCSPDTNQMFYWDENRLRVRSAPELCVAYDTSSKNIEMAKCADDVDSQMWYEDSNPPLRTPEVIYKLIHDGWCGSGLMFEVTVKKIEGCAISCLAKSACGFFAYRNNGDRKDKKDLNCALFARKDKCPDDDTYFEYNAYSVTTKDQQAAQILLATNQTLDAAHISELSYQLSNQNPRDILKSMVIEQTARSWAEGQLDGMLDPVPADNENEEETATTAVVVEAPKPEVEVIQAEQTETQDDDKVLDDPINVASDDTTVDMEGAGDDDDDDDDQALSFIEVLAGHINISSEDERIMKERLEEAERERANGQEQEVEPDDKFEEEREKYGGEFPFLTNAEIEDGPGDIEYDDSWTIEESWAAGNKSEALRLKQEQQKKKQAPAKVAAKTVSHVEKVGDYLEDAVESGEEHDEEADQEVQEDEDEQEAKANDDLAERQDGAAPVPGSFFLKGSAGAKEGSGVTWGRRRRSRRRRTRRRRTVMSSYRYFVVAGSAVQFVTADLEHAAIWMNQHYGGGSPSRMICSIVNGKLDSDPHHIGPANDPQGGGLNYGFDKMWYGWPDVHRMNAICDAFAKVFFSKKWLYTSKFQYCPLGTDPGNQMECQTGAAHLHLRFAGSWNGVNDHRRCVLADDGRWAVYWNTAGARAAAAPVNRNYRSVCISTTTTTTTTTFIDCVGAWGAYSPCTVTCGGGTKTRVYKIDVFKHGIGKECPFKDKETFTTVCRTQACPGKSYGGYVAKTVQEVPDELKRFMSTEAPERCITTSEQYSFEYKNCTTGSDRFQLMEAGSLSTLIWDKFKLSMTEFVPKPVATVVSGRRRRHTSVFLQDFDLNMDCGDHVLKSFAFNANGKLGMAASCTVAATVGAPYEFSLDMTGGDQIATKYKDGTCITADLNEANFVSMQKCKGTAGQRLYWDGVLLKTELSPKKCLRVGGGNALTLADCNTNDNAQKWSFDQEQYLKTASHGNGNCLSYDGNDQVKMYGCSYGTKYRFQASSGIDRLTRTPMVCPEGTVMSRLKKTQTTLEWGCSQVANLGACRPGQTAQIDTSSTTLATVLGLGSVCTEAEGLQSIIPEASKRGEWLRLRYTCCGLGGVPSSVVPTPNLVSDDIAVWEGVYEPVSRDDSGRLVFNQRSTFKRGAGLGNSLAFDRSSYKWCLGKDCSKSQQVHPLDNPMKGDKWQIVPITDFDGEFEAKGVKKPAPAAKPGREPPKLVEFGATKPEYKPECKDDVTPGSGSFSAKKQFEVSASLDAENPCASMGGQAPKGPGGEGEGTWWIADTLNGDKEPGGGITYSSVAGCWQREFDRTLTMDKYARNHDIADTVINTVGTAVGAICNLIPDMTAAPMGMGLEFQPGNVCEGITNVAVGLGTAINDGIMTAREWKNANAGYNDCPPDALGMARIFCDLHCIRDAVKSGDNAILESLENAVDVMGQNMQLLGEHYAGVVTDEVQEVKTMVKELSPTSMQQIAAMRGQLIPMFQEMHGFVVHKPFDDSTAANVQRALDGYSETFASEHKKPKTERFANITLSQHLAHVTRRTEELHAMLHQVSEMTFPVALQVERNAAHYAEKQIKLLAARTSMLGVYHNASHSAKETQLWILSKARPSEETVLAELLEESTQTALSQLDSTWWTMRGAVDRYLWAAKTQMETYEHAVTAIQEYTTQCSIGFSSLRGLHKKVKKAEDAAHEVLVQTWDQNVPLIGALASKIRDTDILGKFLRADIGTLGQNISVKSVKEACSDPKAFGKDVHHQLYATAAAGLFGQTLKQLRLTFLEMAMLEDRLTFGGLGERYGTEDVDFAWKSVEESKRESLSTLNMISKATSKAWRKQHCHGGAGEKSGHFSTDE